jgi:signal peptidase I
LPRLIVSVLLLAWVIRSFIFAPFNIPSGSMLPALYIGDYVMVAKWPYGFSRYSFPWGFPSFDGRIFSSLPKRGDVVVFRAPGTEEDFIKRVVGLPGDRLKVIEGSVYIDGKRQKEPFARLDPECPTCNLPREITIPKGEYYMMGDNRGESADSREWGPVPKKWIIGKAFMTYWPPGRIGLL